MLKRNGQLCRHVVPDYGSRLTDSEFAAYNTVFPRSQKYVSELIVGGNRAVEIEKSLSKYVDSGANASNRYGVTTDDGSKWQIVESLFKVSGVEFLFCKRDAGGTNHFAVVEQWEKPIRLLNTHDNANVHSQGKDVRQLLQNFVQEFRNTLRLWAGDVANKAQEKLEKEFPGQDMSRVVKAISQHCAAAISAETLKSDVQAQKQDVKISV